MAAQLLGGMFEGIFSQGSPVSKQINEAMEKALKESSGKKQ